MVIAYKIYDSDFIPVAVFNTKEDAEKYKKISNSPINLEEVPLVSDVQQLESICYMKFTYSNSTDCNYSVFYTNLFETPNTEDLNNCKILMDEFEFSSIVKDEKEAALLFERLRKHVPYIFLALERGDLNNREELNFRYKNKYTKLNYNDILNLINEEV